MERGEFLELPEQPRIKDYDADEQERPSALAKRFDISGWSILVAFLNGRRAGGAITACHVPEFELVQGRDDLAVLADIRVAPEAKGQGIGKALFKAVCADARDRGCTELWAETQDTNVAACRFYAAVGCTLRNTDPTAYPTLPESLILWQYKL